MSIDHVGVIGAGQMGNGIAHVCALAGYSVVMLDAKAETLTAAMATVTKNMERQVGRKLIGAEDRDPALARIATSTDYAAFGVCDIETATEREEIKHAIFKTLTPHLGGA